MWYIVLNFLYSPLFLRVLSASAPHSEPQRDLSRNSSAVNDPRICRVNSTTALFYPHSNRELRGCYKPSERGPCGDYMILYPTEDGEDKTVGECDCDRKSLRTLIYHEETRRCYPIFQQGYCSLGKWLDLTPSGLPVCQQNPCYEMSANSRENTEDLVLMNGACVKVGSTSGCSAREMVGFELTRRTPTCIQIPKAQVRTIGVPPLKCRPGTYRAISGKCTPKFPFNYDFEE